MTRKERVESPEKRLNDTATGQLLERASSLPPNPITISPPDSGRYFSSSLSQDHLSIPDPEEINRYIASWSPEWSSSIVSLNNQIEKPVDNACHVMVCIPAFQEANNIVQTLEALSQQIADHPLAVEINILDNHRTGGTRDGTWDRVETYKKQHPDLRINYTYAIFPQEAAFGAIRKLIVDLSLYRGQNLPQPPILLSADADTLGYTDDFVANLITEFDAHPGTDLLIGSFNYPPQAFDRYPVFKYSFLFHRMYRDHKESQTADLIWSAGNCSAFSSPSYAAFGGQYPYVKRDIELGRKIQEYRGDSSKQFVRRFSGQVYVDPRRVLLTMNQPGLALTNQFDTNEWAQDKRVTGKNWQELYLPSLEALTSEALEEEFSATLVKKAFRDKAINQLTNLSSAEMSSLGQWLVDKKPVVTEILHSLGFFDFQLDSSRVRIIGGHVYPRVIVINSLPV